MLNPFVLLSDQLLDAFIKAGKKYFVRQGYNRWQERLNENIKGYYVISHYSEIGHAQHHLCAISQDPHRFLYDWGNPEHQEKLRIAGSQPEGYKIYTTLFRHDWQKQVTNALKQKLRNYIDCKLGWSPTARETVGFEIYANYGELYARLKLRSQEIRVKLEDIENMK